MTGYIQITILLLEQTGSSSTLGKAEALPKESPEVNGAGILIPPTKNKHKKECVFKYHPSESWVLMPLTWALCIWDE